MINKRKAEKIHFRRRMKSRYDLIIKKADIIKIIQIIKNGKYEYYEKQSWSRAFCLIDFSGIIVYIVWDRKRGVPMTALPRKAFFDRWRIE